MKPRKKGDRYPMDFVLKENGVIITDAAGSSFTLRMVDRRTGTTKFSAAMTIVSAPLAQVRYTPGAADVDTASDYNLEVDQTRPDATHRHFPSDGFDLLTIQEPLG